MSLPPGFEKNLGSKKVCRLKKSLYDLKQFPRAWFERFGKSIKNCAYYQRLTDHTIFYKHGIEGRVAILIIYVDDIIMAGDDSEELEKLKKRLAADFEIKDLRTLK